MRRIIAGLCVAAALAGIARAEDTLLAPITTSEGCFNAVDALAQKWENHKYASQALKDKIGAALHSLDAQCKASDFAGAQKAATDLKALIAQ